MKWLRLLAAFAGLAACGDSTDPSIITAVDSAGVQLIRSTGIGWSSGEEWMLELALDVGEVDGPNAFGTIRDVAPRVGGGLWVLDGQAGRVRGFDEKGREVAAFGRRGQGPGEFGSVTEVGQLPGGEIAVGASGPIRVHLFNADGSFIADRVVPESLFRDPDSGGGATPSGPTLGRWRFGPYGTPFVHTVVLGTGESGIVRRDVLLRLDHGDRPPGRLIQWNSNVMDHGPAGELRLLMPDAGWAPLTDGGAWWTPGDWYRLRRLDAAGQTVAIIERPGDPPTVTDAVREGVLERLRRTMDSHFERGMLERAVFPERLPATHGLWVSRPSGRLWVGVVDHARDWDYENANAWDVFEPSGEYLGRLPIPAGLRATRITDDGVFGVWRDELGVPHARRYSISRSADLAGTVVAPQVGLTIR